MRKSKMNIAVIYAFNKGYTVDYFGNCFKNGIEVKVMINKNGYKKFSIRIDKEVIPVFIHKMQAFKKFGEKAFEGGICVRHLNGNSVDNSFENIAIGTQKQNMLDVPKEKRILNASNPKYNHLEIIKDRNEGMSYKDIMEKHGISSKGTLSFIVKKSIKLKQVA